MSDWLSAAGSWHAGVGREIRVQLGMRDPQTGNINFENPLVHITSDPLVKVPVKLAQTVTNATIDTARSAMELISTSQSAHKLGELIARVEQPSLDLAKIINFNPKLVESRYLANLINPLKANIDAGDIMRAVVSGKLSPLIINENQQKALVLETPDHKHQLKLLYEIPSKNEEMGKLNIQFKNSEYQHLLDNCNESQFRKFFEFLLEQVNLKQDELKNC